MRRNVTSFPMRVGEFSESRAFRSSLSKKLERSSPSECAPVMLTTSAGIDLNCYTRPESHSRISFELQSGVNMIALKVREQQNAGCRVQNAEIAGRYSGDSSI